MAGRFFTFHLSGYHDYLAENIAKTAHVGQVGPADDLHLVCAGGGGAGQTVVLNRLLLVLLNPFYRDILANRDISTIILPDIPLDQLAQDFFGVLMEFCGDKEDRISLEDFDKLELEKYVKTELIEVLSDSEDNDDDHGEDLKDENDYDNKCDNDPLTEDINKRLSSTPLTICFEDKPIDKKVKKKTKTKKLKLKELKNELTGDKRGQKTCPECCKKYNNRSIPFMCDCGHVLGGTFVSRAKTFTKCTECEYQVFRRNSANIIKLHHDAVHANITYQCEFCEYKSGYKQVLKKHIESLHLGAKYSCKECDYTNKFESGLYQHVQAVHRGIRHMCQFCGHKAIQTSALRKHQKAKHREELEQLGTLETNRSRF